MACDEELADRIRELAAGLRGVSEKNARSLPAKR
jgi:hypothetical protein